MFVEMQILTFEYFICNIPISRLRGKNGSHSEENSKALKMGPIYRDQFVSLHYFSVQLSSTPEASEARGGPEQWGWRKPITMEMDGSKWSHHQKQTRNVQSFCDADPFSFFFF